MDPVSAAIVAALAAGATASINNVASQTVQNAYSELKALIVDRYRRPAAMATIEEDPTSEVGKQALGEALGKTGAVNDAQVQQLAAKLSQEIEALPAESRAMLDVDLKNIEAQRTILLEKLSASGGAKIKVDGAKAGEDFILRDVRAGAWSKP